jgi:hypothetical protein
VFIKWDPISGETGAVSRQAKTERNEDAAPSMSVAVDQGRDASAVAAANDRTNRHGGQSVSPSPRARGLSGAGQTSTRSPSTVFLPVSPHACELGKTRGAHQAGLSDRLWPLRRRSAQGSSRPFSGRPDAVRSDRGRENFRLLFHRDVEVQNFCGRRDVDQIKVGPRGKVLIFGSRKDKKIKFISLTYIQPNFRSYEGILVVSC